MFSVLCNIKINSLFPKILDGIRAYPKFIGGPPVCVILQAGSLEREGCSVGKPH